MELRSPNASVSTVSSSSSSKNLIPRKAKMGDNKEAQKSDNPRKKNRRRVRKRTTKTDQHETDNSTVCLSNEIYPSTSKNPNHIKGRQLSKYCDKSISFQHSTLSAKRIHKHASFKKTSKNILTESFEKLSLKKQEKVQKLKFSEQSFKFEIYPVHKPLKFLMFRKRNTKWKYINLKSFLGIEKTYLFKTKLKMCCKSSESSNESYNEKQIIKHARLEEQNYEDTLINEHIKTANEKQKRKPRHQKHHHKKNVKKQTKAVQGKFPEYITKEEILEGLEKGELVKGFVRINPKSHQNSFVSNDDSSLRDYLITSVADRNRALDGDEVVLKVKPEAEWIENQKTAVVVYILQKVHPRISVGNLKLLEDENSEFAMFYPRDKRLPKILIHSISWPNGFRINPQFYENVLFSAKIIEWEEPNTAIGVITEALGASGNLKVETQAILKEFCLNTTSFSDNMLHFLPESKNIPPEEFKYREDIRKDCIFTIDPLTARDLDDAVSVKVLPNGNYEIGVHISDASYYLAEGTPLDKLVSEKATTIYLVDNVYHMLPVDLCLHCSLLPGEDKLAISVFWEINENGDIFNTRFTRTVLNSCAQLAYEHAQQMIEHPEKEFSAEELPHIFNEFSPKDLSRTVNILQKIAVNLRQARLQNGSLRIDQVKLLFSLNPKTGDPVDFITYENKESHRLIEEFMLLANISVAKKINETFPDIAFLRCHELPKYTMLLEAQKCLETCGIHFDISSSGAINAGLKKYITNDYQGLCRAIVLNYIFAKPMTRARYFCTSTMDNEIEYAHYALSVPIYTHFTSPIRRYADIMVHRLLAASLGYSEKPKWDGDHVQTIAENCNKQKHNAKRASEASSDLYLARYIEKHEPYVQECVVVDVKERSFDAIVLKTGSVVRIHQNKCEDNPKWKLEAIPSSTANRNKNEQNGKKLFRLMLQFPETKINQEKFTVVVEMFSVVNVKLKRVPNSYKLEAFLMRPSNNLSKDLNKVTDNVTV